MQRDKQGDHAAVAWALICSYDRGMSDMIFTSERICSGPAPAALVALSLEIYRGAAVAPGETAGILIGGFSGISVNAGEGPAQLPQVMWAVAFDYAGRPSDPLSSGARLFSRHLDRSA